MPRYDFQCQECSYTFEEERPFEDNSTPPCPQCGKETEKLIAPPAIHFKGEGFYNTDRVKKEEKPKKEAKKEEKKQEKKEAKEETPKKETTEGNEKHSQKD